MKLIGICGTFGKTSTALLICGIIEKAVNEVGRGIRCAYIGSGGVILFDGKTEYVPDFGREKLLCILSHLASAGAEYAVIELSTAFDENDVLEDLEFDLAVSLGGDEDTASAVRLHSRALIVGAEQENGDVIYSLTNGKSDFRVTGCEIISDDSGIGVLFDFVHGGAEFRARLPVPGEYSAFNAAAALSSACYLGVDVNASIDALMRTTTPGRMEVVSAGDRAAFVIDYAYTGYLLERALSVLRKYASGRLICVFGAAGDRYKERSEGLALAAAKYADFCVITSENPNFVPQYSISREILSHFESKSEYTIIDDRVLAIRYAVRCAGAGDVVLFAGKGHERYQLIAGCRVPFCEKNIILDELLAIDEEKRSKSY